MNYHLVIIVLWSRRCYGEGSYLSPWTPPPPTFLRQRLFISSLWPLLRVQITDMASHPWVHFQLPASLFPPALPLSNQTSQRNRFVKILCCVFRQKWNEVSCYIGSSKTDVFSTLYITRLSWNVARVSKKISCAQEVIGLKTLTMLRENVIIERRFLLGQECVMRCHV